MTTALTVEQFIDSMRPWVSATISRSVRRCSALFQREDLMQEANITLVEVFNRYHGAVPEIEMRKIGTRSVFFHVGNLYYRAKSKRAGGEALTISNDEPMINRAEFSGSVIDLAYVRRRDGQNQLDGVILMQEIERACADSAEAREALRAALVTGDYAPSGLDGDAARRIFRRVQKTVREATYRDGYRSEEETMDGLETPDVNPGPAAPAEAAKKKSKAKAPKAAKPKPAAKARRSADDTKKAAGAFKKDQTVTYAGGARAGWLKKGASLTVLGTVVSRGRTYVRCLAGKKKVTLSSTHLQA